MYKVVIGLEVHCELETKSKNFSSAPNTFTRTPNINVAAVDLGLPGILPVVNKEACRKALKTAMALHCENPDEVVFDRKNYFYPDLPKGYQITQVTKPMGRNGYLDVLVNGEKKRILIHQLHLEEDTASLEHNSNFSLIDYNRSGIPLIEIVTEPCIESAEVAVRFLEELRDVFLFCEVSEAKSNYGQMRCDVNISLMKENDKQLGTKVEMKNINAFNSVKAAIEYEIKRQSELLDKGEKIMQETRRIDEDGKTYSMREKVDAVDYKYFIEPNLPKVPLSKEYLDEIRKEIPMLKLERFELYQEKYGLSEYDAGVLSADKKISDYFNEVVENSNDTNLALNFVSTSVLRTLNKLDITIDEFLVKPKSIAELVNRVHDKKISLDHGKKILYQAIKEEKDPIDLIKEQHLEQINDEDKLLEIIKNVMDNNKEQVRQYVEDGNTFVYNFFVGQVMKTTNRQANPNISLELIKQELERRKQNDKK